MDMEGTPEEFVGSSNNDVTHVIVKGKRTKRPRPSSPCGLATVTSSSSSASADHVSGGGDYGSFSSTTTAYESTEEEEDMANCLILLARGADPHKQAEEDHGAKTEKVIGGRKFAEMTTLCAAGKVGFYVYECKTCNRTFPSFQALGGHRASHKKPRTSMEEKKPPTPPGPPPQPLQQNNYEFEEGRQFHMIKSTQISLQLSGNKGFNSNKTKIHECSICGSEFTSGQALGGHMRRHRASTSTSSPVVDTAASAVAVEVKPRNILELDLNLPAPEDDVRDAKFEFTATPKPLMLSAPALVDCHY